MALAQESRLSRPQVRPVLPDVFWTDLQGVIRWVGTFPGVNDDGSGERLIGTHISDLPHLCEASRATLASLVVDASSDRPSEATIMTERPARSRTTLSALAIRTPCPDGEQRVFVWLSRPRGVPDLRRLRELDHLAGNGRIALSAAHDLNNVLVVLGLGLQDLVTEAPAGSPMLLQLRELGHMVDRATHVVRRFRTTGPVLPMHVGVLELGDLLRELRRPLAMLAGATVRLAVNSASWPISVRAGRAALEQALMNLVTNARDAMQGEGELVITATQVAWMGGRMGAGGYLRPGKYGVLEVCDDGPGIPAGALEMLFEPFYTTKPVGVGTGLGLTLVAETALEAGGGVAVESSPGGGATFRIYLPMAGA